MLRKKLILRRSVFARKRASFVGPLIVGLGIWVGSPTATAFSDMVSLVSGMTAQERWNAYVEKSAAGSVHQAEMPFLDASSTGSISGAGIDAPGVGVVALRAKSGLIDDKPDELRINRGEKRDRLLKVAPVGPPKAFTAGSVFDRTSSLRRLEPDQDVRMAFVVPPIKGKEIQIAETFHVRESNSGDPGVPALLASLVTSEKADILATAYSPPEPDYAENSPFASLLEEDDPARGRFIPPVLDDDHAWMAQPLPAGVFTAGEQKCLAYGIYFEARGEALKGQVAVAQVILNRVRNPTYPDTICGVVYQNSSWRNRCQFSFACDGKKEVISSRRHYQIAEDIAMAVTAGKIFLPEVGSSTHYHATYVSPGWARAMDKMRKIGLHIFYRTRDGGWG